MRHDQPGLVDYLFAVEQQVEVDRPWPEARRQTVTAEPVLDLLEQFEQPAGRKIGSDLGDRVQEARLLDLPDRVGLTELRHANERDGVAPPKTVEGLQEHVLSIAEIRAQANERAHHTMVTARVPRAVALGLLLLTLLIAAPAGAATQRADRQRWAPGRADERALAALTGADWALLQLVKADAGGRSLLGTARARLVSRQLKVWRLPLPAGRAALRSLLARGLVAVVEPDRTMRSLGHLEAGDPLIDAQWWLASVGVTSLEPPGPGVPLTVIDSGIDVTHPEFAGRQDTLLLNSQVGSSAEDVHGSSVASVAAAPANGLGIVGVYPRARLQVWDAGSQDDLRVSSIIEGIGAAVAAGPGIINLSLGGPGRDQLLEEAVLHALGAGSIVVAAAGNQFQQGNPESFPASMPHVITVAATDRSNRIAPFSSASSGVDLAAPGEEIPIAVPTSVLPGGYALGTGTSYAAPIVSGALAWLWTLRPELDSSQLAELVRRTARDVRPIGFDTDTGFGLLDVGRALAAAAPLSDPNEPNDDIRQVVAGGLFERAAAPLTNRLRLSASLTARLDAAEDSEDVYRIWAPARRTVEIAIEPRADVDVELWDGTTRSVTIRGSARREHLLDGSYRTGRRAEHVTFDNPTGRAAVAFLDVYIPLKGPSAAAYTVSVRTLPLGAGLSGANARSSPP